MALQTCLIIGPVFKVTRFPAAGMGICFAAGVTGEADVTFGVACLARLQVAARFGRVLALPVRYGITLPLPLRIVRFDLQRSFGEAAVTGSTVFLVMAAVALLLVVLRLYRVDADEVAAVTAGMGITAEGLFSEIGSVQQATLMAVKTP